MRILILSQYFYPENFKINDIAFDFQKAGHDVTVLTGKPNYPQGKIFEGYTFFNRREEVINGVKVIRVPLFPRLDGRGAFMILNYLSFLFFTFFAVFFRLKNEYDIVFSHLPSPLTSTIPGIWIKKRFNIPLVIWVLDLWPESVIANSKHKKGFVINTLNKIVNYIYQNTDKILVSSHSFKKSISEKFNVPNNKIDFFPNWAEDIFTINNNDSNITIPSLNEGFNIMFAGNVGESQDFESILNAAELTEKSNIIWNIVGDGRKKKWVENELKIRKIKNVTLLGRFSLESMPEFFKQADVMLVSLKNDPTFAMTIPAKVQAYMASGKVILGMLDGEGKKLINDSNCGICVSAGDYKSLANEAINLSDLNILEIKKLERSSVNYYNINFSKDMLFEKLESLFKTSLYE